MWDTLTKILNTKLYKEALNEKLQKIVNIYIEKYEEWHFWKIPKTKKLLQTQPKAKMPKNCKEGSNEKIRNRTIVTIEKY